MRRHAPSHRPGTATAPVRHRHALGQRGAHGTRHRALARPQGRRTISTRARVVLALTGATVGVTFLCAGAALAFFVTTDSSNPAAAAAATLSAPTGGTQNGTATPNSIPIKWNAPSGYTPTGYTVLRCTGSSCTNFTAISNGTCQGTISGTSCTDSDTGLAAGTTYSYKVEAQFHNWLSSPGTSFQASTTAAAKLVFTAQPTSGQNIQATGTGSFGVSVTIEDANGVPVSNDNTDTVTLAIASGHSPGGGTLSCTNTGGLTATVSSGVATFTGCAITKAGSGYQLTASSATSTSLTAPTNANSFNITAGTASQVIATSGGGQSATVLVTFTNPLVATVEDVNGNPVAGATVTFAAPSTGASVTFASSGCTSNPHPYSCVATTGAGGQATSSAFTANGTLGSYSISASAPGASSASFSETNAATAISSLATANGNGGTVGKIDANDTITIGFNGQIDASKVCSGWTNNSSGTQSNSSAVVTVANNGVTGHEDILTIQDSACSTFNFGSIDLGSNQYVKNGGSPASAVFSGSTIAYNGTTHKLQITLGTLTLTGSEGTVTSSALILSLSSSVLDTADNSLGSYTFTSATGQQF